MKTPNQKTILSVLMLFTIIILNSLLLSTPTSASLNTSKKNNDIGIDVLQYNVQFLTPWNPGIEYLEQVLPDTIGELVDNPHWPNTKERAVSIGMELACFDIISLNESVNSNRRREIMRAMEESAPDCGKPSQFSDGRYFDLTHGPEVLLHITDLEFILWDGLHAWANDEDIELEEPVLGNELSIISRFPIIEVNSHIFESSSGFDSIISKGVLHARVWRGGENSANQVVDVFSTHLQAGDSVVRANQVDEMAAFIEEHMDPSIPLILMGDFNINGSPEGEGNSEYRELMNAIEPLGLIDPGTHLGGTNEQRTKRIDYIFSSQNGLSVNNIAVEEFPDPIGEPLSDHAAIKARMTWSKANEEPLPAINQWKKISVKATRLQAKSTDSCNFLDWLTIYGVPIDPFTDFYGSALIRSGSTERASFGVMSGNDIGPNLIVSQEIPPEIGSVYAEINIEDDDDPVCGGTDDHVDIHPFISETKARLKIDLVNQKVYLLRGTSYIIKQLGDIGVPFTIRGDQGDELGQITIVVTSELVDRPPTPDPLPVDSSKAITVHVDRLTATSEDSCDEMEFYGSLELLNGASAFKEFGEVEGDDILPADWFIETTIPPEVNSIDAHFRIREEDDVVCGGGDDDVDVNPAVNQKDLIIRIDLSNSLVMRIQEDGTADSIIGTVGNNLIQEGYNGDETAQISFSIDVEEAPQPLSVNYNRHLNMNITNLLALSEDSCRPMSFYAKELSFSSGANAFESYDVMRGDNIYPNWSVSTKVEPNIATVDGLISIFDEDWYPFCGGNNDHVDINPSIYTRDLETRIDLQTNEVYRLGVTGVPVEPIGSIGQSITLRGTQDNETAQITFQIDNELYCESNSSVPSCQFPDIFVDINALTLDASNDSSPVKFKVDNRNAPMLAQWEVSANEPWLVFGRSSGFTPDEIEVRVNPAGLAGGTHSALITVSSPDSSSVETIPVTLNLPDDHIDVDIDTLSFEAGPEANSTILSVRNLNASNQIDWSAVASESWITLDRSSGLTPAELEIEVDTESLTPGVHIGEIRLNSTTIVPVEVNVPEDALKTNRDRIVVSEYTFFEEVSIQIRNTNFNKSIRWEATVDQPWLNIDVSSGETPTNIIVQVDESVILEGANDVGFITFNSPDLPEFSLAVPVEVPEPSVQVIWHSYFPTIAFHAGADLIVEGISFSETGLVTVEIKNQGSMPTNSSFWVDVYFEPEPIPTNPNDIWEDGRSKSGLVWGITEIIFPGEKLILTQNSPYFWPSLSSIPDLLPTDERPIYVQVDSANMNSGYGAVMEIHESLSGTYNNIFGPVPLIISSTRTVNQVTSKETLFTVNPKIGSLGIPPNR